VYFVKDEFEFHGIKGLPRFPARSVGRAFRVFTGTFYGPNLRIGFAFGLPVLGYAAGAYSPGLERESRRVARCLTEPLRAIQHFISETDRIILRHTIAEYHLLDMLRDNRQLVIEGGPGSGGEAPEGLAQDGALGQQACP